MDEGNGPILLFLHGAPNWAFFHRQFIGDLRDDFRCIALDFPGFGLSPSHSRYPATIPVLSRLVEHFVETLDLRDIILVLGDAGGPIGLGVAARHPDWFAGLVLAGTFGWSLKEYPKVRRMLGIVSSPIFGFLQPRSAFHPLEWLLLSVTGVGRGHPARLGTGAGRRQSRRGW